MKVALVTGGSGGIGFAIAKRLIDDGYHVAVTGRSLETLLVSFADVDRDLIHCIEADATKFESYSDSVEKTIDRFGQLNLLVNSVGGGTLGQTLEKATLESWDATMNLNARSAFFMAQAALSYLIDTRGTIINFSSILASRPIPGLAPYSASKAAVEMITQSLALELASKRIRVLCISPATIQTNFHTSAGMSAETAAAYYVASAQTHPIGRIGVPEDISELVAFLADSKKAGFMTGSVIHVDGGRMLTSAVAANLQK